MLIQAEVDFVVLLQILCDYMYLIFCHVIAYVHPDIQMKSGILILFTKERDLIAETPVTSCLWSWSFSQCFFSFFTRFHSKCTQSTELT